MLGGKQKLLMVALCLLRNVVAGRYISVWGFIKDNVLAAP